MKTVEKNDVVYFQESRANSVYFLKEGNIRISKFNSEGEELLIRILNPGEIFGEASIMAHRTRKEAAIAEEKVCYCVMREDKMRELLFMAPALNFKFSQMIEERLEKAQKRLEDLSFKNNHQRIVDFIKALASSSNSQNGEIIINNSFTHDKIAKLTSTNRQEVSSVFSYLKKNQIIDYDRKFIRILKMKDLELS